MTPSQFDEGGAQFLQGHPEPLRSAESRTSPQDTGQGEDRHGFQQVHQFAETVADQNLSDLLETAEVADAADGKKSHPGASDQGDS